jgi:hypothetical protein
MATWKEWLKGVGKYDLACIASGGLIGLAVGGSTGGLIGLLVGTMVGLIYATIWA